MKHEGRVPKECVSTRWHKDTEIPSPKKCPCGWGTAPGAQIPPGAAAGTVQFPSVPALGKEVTRQPRWGSRGVTAAGGGGRGGGGFQLCASRREGAVSPGKLLFPERRQSPLGWAALGWAGTVTAWV